MKRVEPMLRQLKRGKNDLRDLGRLVNKFIRLVFAKKLKDIDQSIALHQ